MGKDSKKGKEKKEARKAELAAEHARKDVVRAANAVIDPLESLAPFRKYARNGCDASFTVMKGADAPAEVHTFCYDLLHDNMHDAQVEAGFPWKESEVRGMLKDEVARLLLMKEGDAYVGFAHYRYELEGECTVLTVYELIIAEAARGKGLGKHSMSLLELVAMRHGMMFVMATVIKACDGAMRFFLGKMKYQVDEGSPSRCEIEDESSYEILSKRW